MTLPRTFRKVTNYTEVVLKKKTVKPSQIQRQITLQLYKVFDKPTEMCGIEDLTMDRKTQQVTAKEVIQFA